MADDLKARARPYLAYRAGAEVARALPDAVGEPAARVVGRVVSLAMPQRRRLVARNLQRVTGGTARGGRPCNGRCPTPSPRTAATGSSCSACPRTRRGRSTRGSTSTASSTSRPRSPPATGVILALPHLGGWDFAGAWLAQQGHPPTVVVEPVEPPELFEWFAGAREALGMEVVPLGPDAGRAVLRRAARATGSCACCRPRPRRRRRRGRVLRRAHHDAGRAGHARAPHGRAAPARRRLLPAAGRAPRRSCAAGAGRAGGPPARRCRARHPGARPPLRGADPHGPRAVAPDAAELAQ